MLFQLQTVYSI